MSSDVIKLHFRLRHLQHGRDRNQMCLSALTPYTTDLYVKYLLAVLHRDCTCMCTALGVSCTCTVRRAGMQVTNLLICIYARKKPSSPAIYDIGRRPCICVPGTCVLHSMLRVAMVPGTPSTCYLYVCMHKNIWNTDSREYSTMYDERYGR